MKTESTQQHGVTRGHTIVSLKLICQQKSSIRAPNGHVGGTGGRG